MRTVMIDGTEWVPRINIGCGSQYGSLGQALNAFRKQCGMSLDDAARLIGCTKSFLWNLEKDRSEPGLRLAAKIADAYAVPISALSRALNGAKNSG